MAMETDMSDKMLTGLVAGLLSDTSVIVNIGANQGVTEGMRASVIRQRRVVDPQTREQLGTAREVLVRLRVESVEPKFCVARTTLSIRRKQGPLDELSSLTRVRQRVTLDPVASAREGEEVRVEVGDLVELVWPPETGSVGGGRVVRGGRRV